MTFDINNWNEQEIVRNIGQRVKKRREIMELTQEKLAEMMDISITTISRLENGQQCMSIKNLIKLGKILQLDVAEFFSSYKFSTPITIKDDDKQIIDILNQCTPQQKKYFIAYMKWMLDNYTHMRP